MEKDNKIKAKDIKPLVDFKIAIKDADGATELLNRFGMYLSVTDLNKYIKQVQKLRA